MVSSPAACGELGHARGCCGNDDHGQLQVVARCRHKLTRCSRAARGLACGLGRAQALQFMHAAHAEPACHACGHARIEPTGVVVVFG